ncbi:MAG: rhodanese-like domain-containing protein [Bdellovibrionales bacterium]|nr:rhodanese-like domain-containing protein [Bdellovibrionales bacterium]
MSDYFEIGYFQLENLSMNQVQFYFFDISMSRLQVSDEPLKSMLQSMIGMEPEDIEPYLKEKDEAKTVPIVLLCEDGVRSRKWAEKLSDAGYINVNVIEEGFKGLEEEANSLTHS